MRIDRSVYHDKSSKGCGKRPHARHDCWRGDIRIWEKQNGVWRQTHRKRKRFRIYEEAYEWVKQQEILKND